MSTRFAGPYSQPIESFGKFRAQGCNLLVASELKNGTVSQPVWRAAARANGFSYIDTYFSDADVNDAALVGWMVKGSDEWNRRLADGKITAADVAGYAAEADRLAALNAARGTNKLIFANADGQHVTAAIWEKPPYSGVKNGEMILLPKLTARSADWYPVMFTTPGQESRRPMHLPAQAVWRIRSWCDARPDAKPAVYASFIETSKKWNAPLGVTGPQIIEQFQYLNGDRPFPVPDANANPVNAQKRMIDILILWTANGQDGPGWNWDARTPEQVAASVEMTNRFLGLAPNPQPAPPPDTQTLAQVVATQAAQGKDIAALKTWARSFGGNV